MFLPAFKRTAVPAPSRISVTASHALFLLSLPLTLTGYSNAASAQTASAPQTLPADPNGATPVPTSDAALSPVTVSAKAENAAANTPTFGGGTVAKQTSVGVFGNQALIDLPFDVTSYTEKAVKDSQKATVAAFLQATDPNVRTAYTLGSLNQQLVIRGFELFSDDIALGGLYGLTPRTMVSTDAIARVDIFKGASAFIYGAPTGGSGVGGMVNVELKRADDKPLTEVTTGISASGHFGAHVDIGRRFGDNDQFGIRFNQSDTNGRSAIDGQKNYDKTTALALDWRGDKLRFTADFLYQKQKTDEGRSSLTVNGGIPALPSATSNASEQPWVYSNFEDTVGMVGVEYDFAPGWTAYVKGGLHHGNERSTIAGPTFTQSTGLVTGSRFDTAYKADSSSAEAGVHGKFDTGPVSHQFNASASIATIQAQTAFLFGGQYTTSLANVNTVPLPNGTAFGDLGHPLTTAETVNKGISVSDTIGLLHDRVLFTLGAREQEIRQDAYSSTDGSRSSTYAQSIATPIFGIVFKLMPNWSVYANRTEALVAGGTASATASNFGQVFAPFRSKQYEVGTKYDFGNYGANLALFQIEQPSAYFDAATNLSVQGGKQRNRGVEIGFTGEPVRGVRLNAGGSYTQATLESAVTAAGAGNPSADGNTAPGVPRWLANVGAEYDVPHIRGLTLTGAWIFSSSQYADQANTLRVGSWSRFDLGARYTTQIYRKDVTVRATLENVGNRAYWASAYGGYLTLGDPRTFWISVTTDF